MRKGLVVCERFLGLCKGFQGFAGVMAVVLQGAARVL